MKTLNLDPTKHYTMEARALGWAIYEPSSHGRERHPVCKVFADSSPDRGQARATGVLSKLNTTDRHVRLQVALAALLEYVGGHDITDPAHPIAFARRIHQDPTFEDGPGFDLMATVRYLDAMGPRDFSAHLSALAKVYKDMGVRPGLRHTARAFATFLRDLDDKPERREPG